MPRIPRLCRLLSIVAVSALVSCSLPKMGGEPGKQRITDAGYVLEMGQRTTGNAISAATGGQPNLSVMDQGGHLQMPGNADQNWDRLNRAISRLGIPVLSRDPATLSLTTDWISLIVDPETKEIATLPSLLKRLRMRDVGLERHRVKLTVMASDQQGKSGIHAVDQQREAEIDLAPHSGLLYLEWQDQPTQTAAAIGFLSWMQDMLDSTIGTQLVTIGQHEQQAQKQPQLVPIQRPVAAKSEAIAPLAAAEDLPVPVQPPKPTPVSPTPMAKPTPVSPTPMAKPAPVLVQPKTEPLRPQLAVAKPKPESMPVPVHAAAPQPVPKPARAGESMPMPKPAQSPASQPVATRPAVQKPAALPEPQAEAANADQALRVVADAAATWDAIRDSLWSQKIGIAHEDIQSLTIQTEWAMLDYQPKTKQLKQRGGAKGPRWAFTRSGGGIQRHRFLLEIEANGQPGAVLIIARHTGYQEQVDMTPDASITQLEWVDRPLDPEIATAFLRRLKIIVDGN